MGKAVLGKDFGRLWAAYAVSAAGSTVGAGALALVAILLLDASAWQVSLLTAVAAFGSALLALPFGARIEFRTKRPVMIGADLARFVTLASVPAAAALHVLTMAQLYAVAVVQSAAFVAFAAASGAHLKALVTPAQRAEANSRFETTDWTCWTVGPPLGGLLVGAVGATATMLVDAVSFLWSALGVRDIRTPEPAPPARSTPAHLRHDITDGWRYVLRHPALRPLFVNAMVFGGAVLMVSPLEAVLMLQDLGFAPWEYGLVLGLPCLGGVLGARLAPRLTARFGVHRVLLWGGVARTPWLLVIPFVRPGVAGVVLLVALNFGLLLSAGVFNPTFATHRMDVTRDDMMARVGAVWSISGRTVKPLFIAAGGAVAAVADVRTALGVGGVLCVLSAVLVPRSGAAVEVPEDAAVRQK